MTEPKHITIPMSRLRTLEQAEVAMYRMRTPLRVIRTWAANPPLDARRVRDLCDYGLATDDQAASEKAP